MTCRTRLRERGKYSERTVKEIGKLNELYAPKGYKGDTLKKGKTEREQK